MSNFYPLRSSLEGITFPSIVNNEASQLLSILYQLDQTQWLSESELLEHQFKQLRPLLIHGYHTTNFYKKKLDEINFNPLQNLTLDTWQKIPILTRSDIQKEGNNLMSQLIPKVHGNVSFTETSGSTGQPVKVAKTALCNLFWRGFSVREHLWHRQDHSKKLAVIRYFSENSNLGQPPDGRILPNWGSPINLLYNTGQAVTLSISTDVSIQAQWLLKNNPHYLLTYPSNLLALAEYFQETGEKLTNLTGIRTISEMITPKIRQIVKQTWDINITDTYSSQEVGYIAIQCPQCEQYHIQSENVLVEVLNEENKPCKVGEIGRIIVTDLHNFAMPLIRYEILDYARVGKPCKCGRGLPTLTEIVGRKRNMVTHPNGEKRWPLLGYNTFIDKLPIRQILMVQKTLTDIEVKLVTKPQLSLDQEQELKEILTKSLGYPFNFQLNYIDYIPRKANGKFEEFFSELSK
jgi:phenylacetate-CoA ligase